MQQKIRELLCVVTRDDASATAELNRYVFDRVVQHISQNRTSPTLVRPAISHSYRMYNSCVMGQKKYMQYMDRVGCRKDVIG